MTEKYKPEDVIETEGIDKGRIKDKSLAEIGATQEDLAREGKSPFKGIMEDPDYENREHLVGVQAMSNEIYDRASRDMSERGVTDKSFQEIEADHYQDEFWKTTEGLSEEREQEAQRKYLEEEKSSSQ